MSDPKLLLLKVKVKWSRYRPGVAQRVGRGIALLFHDRGTRRGSVVSSTPRPHFSPGKDPVPIVQEAGWAPGPVFTGGKSRPHRDSIPDRPARSQSLYRLSYRARTHTHTHTYIYMYCIFFLQIITKPYRKQGRRIKTIYVGLPKQWTPERNNEKKSSVWTACPTAFHTHIIKR